MKMEIELSDIQINDVVRNDLIESYKILVSGSRLFEDDEQLTEALAKIIEYYSNKDQFEEFHRTYMKQIEEFKVPDVVDIAVDKNDYPLLIKPSYTIQMHNDNGIVGTLDFNDSVLKFEGNADESAEIFINAICGNWTERLEQERISAAKWCIDIIENCDGDLDYAIFDIKKEFGIKE